MALAEVTKSTDNRMTVNDAMDELLSKLDVAIDDMEQGRVQPIDDAWKEIDIIKKKKYILESFKYRDYAENYSSKIRKAAKELETFPYAYQTSGFLYRGYEIYYYPRAGHLLFFIVNEQTRTVTILRVLQDGMDWQRIINKWIQQN